MPSPVPTRFGYLSDAASSVLQLRPERLQVFCKGVPAVQADDGNIPIGQSLRLPVPPLVGYHPYPFFRFRRFRIRRQRFRSDGVRFFGVKPCIGMSRPCGCLKHLLESTSMEVEKKIGEFFHRHILKQQGCRKPSEILLQPFRDFKGHQRIDTVSFKGRSAVDPCLIAFQHFGKHGFEIIPGFLLQKVLFRIRFRRM